MKFFKHRVAFGLLVVGSLILLAFAGSVGAAGPPSVGLGTAGSYGVLAGDTITNTGATTINGDLGLFPGTAVVGSPTVIGAQNVNNSAAQIAKNDLRTAYLNAEGRTGPTLVAAGALGGRTLAPGLYKDDGAPASLGIATGQTLTLDGDSSSVWIPVRVDADHGDRQPRRSHGRRPGVQRLLAGRQLDDPEDRIDLRRPGPGAHGHLRPEQRHDRRPDAGRSAGERRRRADARYRHDHEVELRGGDDDADYTDADHADADDTRPGKARPGEADAQEAVAVKPAVKTTTEAGGGTSVSGPALPPVNAACFTG